MREPFRGPAFKEMDIPAQGKCRDFNKDLPVQLMAMSSYRPKVTSIIRVIY